MSLYSRTLLNSSLVLAGLLFSSIAMSLDKDKSAPVTINADTTNIDFRTGKRVLTGNVDITQGTLNIKADKVVLIYKGDDIDTATAYGKPVKFKQLPEGHTEIVYGEGKTLELKQAKDLITLKNNAKITQGTNIITGKVIYYNTKKSKMTVKGQTSTKQKSTTAGKQKSPTTTQSADQKTDSGRTRIVIQPGSMKK
jgi:lipopolysaccharide export system protein LptA